jgi:hypothetical protein
MDAANRGDDAFLKNYWYPDIRSGAQGVKFVNTCVESADAGAIWVKY